MLISVVIPTFKRGHRLEANVVCLNQYFESLERPYELILVDDGSNDGTEAVIKALTQHMPALIGIILKYNVGQQNATLAGVRQSKGDVVLTLDDDLEYDLSAVEQILEKLEKGDDVVYVVNALPSGSTFRRYGTELKERFFEKFLGKPQAVQLTSYRGMKRWVADYVSGDAVKKVYLSARLLQLRPTIGQATSDYKAHVPVTSTYTAVKLVMLLLVTIVHYGNLPLLKHFKGYGEQYRIKEIYTCD